MEIINQNNDPGNNNDPFDPAKLRLSQDFGQAVGVKKLLTTVPVRKPHGQEFVQVHPNPEYAIVVAVIEIKEDREIFVVDPALCNEIGNEISRRFLFTSINRQNVLFLWPIRCPSEDGRTNNWNRSALDGAERGRKGWIRIQANMSLGAYEIAEPQVHFPAPEWPDISFSEILKIAFKDRYINSIDHPVLRKLRGEI